MCPAYSISIWEKETELRDAQQSLQEKEAALEAKEAMLQANAQQKAQYLETIAELERQLASCGP